MASFSKEFRRSSALEPASVRQADCDAAALPIVLHARLLDDEAGGVGFPLN